MTDAETIAALQVEVENLRADLEASKEAKARSFLRQEKKYADALVKASELKNELARCNWAAERLAAPGSTEYATEDELNKAEKAHYEASPPPWSGGAQQPDVWLENADGKHIADIDTWVGKGIFDLDVICWSRNLLMKLILEVRAARTQSR